MNEEIQRKRMSLDIVLAAAAVVGVTVGVILSLKMDDTALVSLAGAERKLSAASDGGWFGVFLDSFLGTAVFLCAVFLCGFSAVAQPAEIFLAAFRGVGLGLCVRGVYLGGNVLASMAAFLPFAVASTGVLILSARQAFYLSMRYLSLSVTNENRLGIRSYVHDYTAKFLLYLLLLAVLAASDALLAGFLAGIM